MLLLPLLAVASLQAPAKPPLRYVEKIDNMSAPPHQIKPLFQDALGAALAHELGRRVTYVQLPRKRVVAALENGQGDVLCSYLPQWLPGDVAWTRSFIPVSEVIVASPRVPAPASLEELRGKTIGTVLGFRYPELEQVLGQNFMRDDAPSTMLAARKWAAGRFDYFITARQVVDDLVAQKVIPSSYHLLTVYETRTMCAVSRRSAISVDEFNAAIEAIEKNGELTRALRLR